MELNLSFTCGHCLHRPPSNRSYLLFLSNLSCLCCGVVLHSREKSFVCCGRQWDRPQLIFPIDLEDPFSGSAQTCTPRACFCRASACWNAAHLASNTTNQLVCGFRCGRDWIPAHLMVPSANWISIESVSHFLLFCLAVRASSCCSWRWRENADLRRLFMQSAV